MQNSVFVLSSDKAPLNPCHPARARKLLKVGRAAVYRRFPFTIILKDKTYDECEVDDHRTKIDPGSKTTGLALVNERTKKVVWAAELEHRGHLIRESLASRSQQRRARRSRKTRYRKPRWLNRANSRREGRLGPSLMSRVHNIETWVLRLARYTPSTYTSLEHIKFDMQLMENPLTSGVEYQQGTLMGYEIKEYLLERDGRKCAYCGADNVPLEAEHIIPKSRGGSNRVDNLTPSCKPCNLAKGAQTAAEFGFPYIQAQVKAHLRDAAAVNATRWKLYETLRDLGFLLELGTGGRTKYNRLHVHNLPKTHWIDAACVGETGETTIVDPTLVPLRIRAMGHGSRQMQRVNKYGFPRTEAKGPSRVEGFKTGDMVLANVPASSKKAGKYRGRVAVRSSGSFNIKTSADVVQGISWKHLTKVHAVDGYAYFI